MITDGITEEFAPVSIDITNIENVSEVINEIRPNITILTAAMTDVDRCEEESEKAYSINAQGPENVAKAIKAIKGRLIHISTDFIFDGEKGDYIETDTPNPLSVYGQTKLDGEELILAQKIPTIICRSSVLFGWPEIRSAR